jgi:hypothetical protein
MRRLEKSWVFNGSAEDIWNVVTNFDNLAKASLSKGDWVHTPAGPTQLGTTVESSRHMFGRSRRVHSYVVTEFEPFRIFGMTDKVPGLKKMAQRFTFEPTPEGTRVTRSIDLDLGRGRLLEPAFQWMLYRMWPMEAAGVRRLVEKAAAPVGSVTA